MHEVVIAIREAYQRRGGEMYGVEAVTQLQHALHCAGLAMADDANDELVVAAFLHDIGHVLAAESFPTELHTNLDDHHEARGWLFLKGVFSPLIADVVRLHVAAKRWLCTVDPTYAERLSPTSYKSFLDQGGPMSAAECECFQSEAHHDAAVKLRRWDDAGKDPQADLPSLDHIMSLVEKVLSQAS